MFAMNLGHKFYIIALSLHWLDTILYLTEITVVNVPKGLLATATVCLTLTS
jgi:hypothetical protein